MLGQLTLGIGLGQFRGFFVLILLAKSLLGIRRLISRGAPDRLVRPALLVPLDLPVQLDRRGLLVPLRLPFPLVDGHFYLLTLGRLNDAPVVKLDVFGKTHSITKTK